MTTTDYRALLDQARRVAPEERRLLREELVTLDLEAGSTPPPLPPARLLTDEERAELEAWFIGVDELAARIGAAWKDEMNAAEAVKEQRRDL